LSLEVTFNIQNIKYDIYMAGAGDLYYSKISDGQSVSEANEI